MTLTYLRGSERAFAQAVACERDPGERSRMDQELTRVRQAIQVMSGHAYGFDQVWAALGGR